MCDPSVHDQSQLLAATSSAAIARSSEPWQTVVRIGTMQFLVALKSESEEMAEALARVRLSEDAIFSQVGSGSVALQMNTDLVYSFDAVATFFIESIEECDGELRRIKDKMLTHYDVDAVQLSHDIDQLTSYLFEHKLLIDLNG